MCRPIFITVLNIKFGDNIFRGSQVLLSVQTDRQTDGAITLDTWPKWEPAKNATADCGILVWLTGLYEALCSLDWEASLGMLRKWAGQSNEISRKIIREEKEEERRTRPEKKWDKRIAKEIDEGITVLDIAKCILIVRPSNNSVSTATSILYPEDGISTSFQNAGIYLQRYTASHAGRKHLSRKGAFLLTFTQSLLSYRKSHYTFPRCCRKLAISDC